MKKTITTAAVLAALALTGCTAGNQSADAAPSSTAASSAPATASATPSATKPAAADPGQVWADKMINLFLNGNSKSTFAEFNKEIPHHYITEWGQESEGVMSVTVSGNKWTQCEMDELAVTVMSTAGHETPDMKKVVTYSDSKNLKGSTDRSGMNFGTPDSC